MIGDHLIHRRKKKKLCTTGTSSDHDSSKGVICFFVCFFFLVSAAAVFGYCLFALWETNCDFGFSFSFGFSDMKMQQLFSRILLAIASALLLGDGEGGAAEASLLSYPGHHQSNLNHTCQLQTPILSCSADAGYPNVTDSCCTETEGGLVLQTQFWNTYTGLESAGQVLPRDTWTMHGLWPDFCNGSYTQYCDLSRQYDPLPSPNTTTGEPDGTPVVPYHGPSIATFLEPFGKLDLLAFMRRFWLGQGQPSADLWAHEFSKHATCFSTFALPCYGPMYQEHAEVVDFFETAVAYYRNLPTYAWLSAKEIRPSNSTRYSLTDLQGALTEGFGALPYIGCSGPRYNATAAGNGTTDNGYTVVSEVWYYYHVYGRVQENQGVPVNASVNGGSVSSCAKAKGALSYYLRTDGSEA
ncbi:hypothetical protein LZ554_008857 [Drepanopeziza brunnea f. sp. 'monogermtubi']|nr:hypothetical protein LZ554_008857 [Drepanopeziza brunnea f. sp. 'monogermtubi']